MAERRSTTRGFKQTASLVQTRIRHAAESRGFAQVRLLTHWAEIVGSRTAALCRPVEVSYGRGGMGATLTVLTTGPQAPMLEMQKEQIRDRVNAAYGYNAIARLRITQTAPTGFAEGQAQFAPAPPQAPPAPAPEVLSKARAMAAGTQDETLRATLETLATHFISKQSRAAKRRDD